MLHRSLQETFYDLKFTSGNYECRYGHITSNDECQWSWLWINGNHSRLQIKDLNVEDVNIVSLSAWTYD